jgi:hypothetical protein
MAQIPADRIHAHHDLSHDGIEKQPDSVRRFGFAMYLAGGGAGLQQPIAKIEAKQIMHWYQHLIYANERASDASPHKCRMSQIWPHFAACASTRCGRP